MVKLRQTARPADKANWTEHFYTGSLKVKNGVAETENLVWVSLLQERGFTVVNENVAEAAPSNVEGLEEALGDTQADEVPDLADVPNDDSPNTDDPPVADPRPAETDEPVLAEEEPKSFPPEGREAELRENEAKKTRSAKKAKETEHVS